MGTPTGAEGAPTDAERAAFEVGIKFGTLYHQFAGTPVSPESAEGLAEAMEAAVENQPYCEAVTVDPHEERIRRAIEGLDPLGNGGAGEGSSDDANAASDGTTAESVGASATYTELTGTLYDAEIEVERADQRVLARMEIEDGYPLMRLVDVYRDG